MRLLMAILSTLLFSCTASNYGKVSNENQTADDVEYTVILNNTRDHTNLYQPASLDSNEIREIERLIKLAVKENNQKQKDILQKQNQENPKKKLDKTGFEIAFDGYKRQYVARINGKGEKEVWVNCFCLSAAAHHSNWKNQLVFVKDGGNCYYNLVVNLTLMTYYELKINGYA